jgi:Trypsin-like peptidase domain
LDFTLLTLAGNPVATYGYLPLNGENLQPGDPLYVIQHPGGGEKKIHARHTGTANEDCVVKDSDWSEPGYSANSSIQHTCDTEGGSSGSPVLNDNNQIVALHHTGYAGSPALCSNNGGAGAPCNGAIEMEQILPLIRGDLPADRGGSGGTTGWVWYRSQESWRYESGASERVWNFFLNTSATAWVDSKAQPTLAEMFAASSQSGHWLGLYWTSATNWSNARLWYQ